MKKHQIIDLKGSKRKNLKSKASRKRTEINFQRKIESILFHESRDAVGLREVEINGYGIADLIIFQNTNKIKTPYYINAYEIKIRNWKKALQQAYRYSYYANQAVVIMPEEYTPTGDSQLSLFSTMNIGLWSYDSKNHKIKKIITPNNNTPKNKIASNKALNFIESEISNFCKINK